MCCFAHCSVLVVTLNVWCCVADYSVLVVALKVWCCVADYSVLALILNVYVLFCELLCVSCETGCTLISKEIGFFLNRSLMIYDSPSLFHGLATHI